MAEQQTETIWKDRKHFMWWPLSFCVYEIRNDRLYRKSGLLNTTLEELLLYRIVDLSLHRSLAQRIFGTGTIVLTTRGDSEPVVRLENIANSLQVRELLSKEVERSRIRHNIVGREFYGDTLTRKTRESADERVLYQLAHDRPDFDPSDTIDSEKSDLNKPVDEDAVYKAFPETMNTPVEEWLEQHKQDN